MNPDFRMHAERTPNPDSIKWVLSQPVAGDSSTASFRESPDEEISPLASRLFRVEGVVGVFLGFDFVTVSKSTDREWTDLAGPVVEGIKAWVTAGEVGVGPGYTPAQPEAESEVVSHIRRILEEDIQPYVARDGGEITFAGFQNGVVEVYLQGACSGCPSSTITLKMGIEARLKEEIPEVVEVVAL